MPTILPGRADPRLVPAPLERSLTEDYLWQFVREFQPVGPTETAIVGDLARQRAAMERWSAAGEAAGRQAARCLPAIALSLSFISIAGSSVNAFSGNSITFIVFGTTQRAVSFGITTFTPAVCDSRACAGCSGGDYANHGVCTSTHVFSRCCTTAVGFAE